jgi:N-acetylneuraminic acid mutarotase
MNTKSFFSFMLCSIGLLAHNTEGRANTWTQKATAPFSAFGASGFTVGNKAYVYIGPANVFWEYDQASDSWTQRALFPGIPRSEAVGFAIDGKGYVCTGRSTSGSGLLLNDLWEYDTATNTWTQRADFGGTARSNAVGFTISAKGYVGTGVVAGVISCTGARNDFWEYDPASDTWTEKAPVGGGGRGLAAGFALGNRGYIGGGSTFCGNIPGTTSGLGDFWEYDPAYNTWSLKANIPGLLRESAVGFSIGEFGFIGGGIESGGALFPGGDLLSDLWRYAPSSNTWEQQADFVFPNPWLGFSIGSKGYSLRGNALHEYDPNNTNTWTQKPPFGGTGRTAAVGFSIGTKGYITTGNDGFIFDNPLNDLWVFDQATGAWNQKADLPGPARMWATGFAIGGKGYVGTGCDAGLTNHVLNDFWEYDPVQNNWTQKADLPGAARQKAIGFRSRWQGLYRHRSVDHRPERPLGIRSSNGCMDATSRSARDRKALCGRIGDRLQGICRCGFILFGRT